MGQFDDFSNPWSASNSQWFNEEYTKWINPEFNENIVTTETKIRKVEVIITNDVIGEGLVRAYPNTNGKTYVVPLYDCIIKGKLGNGTLREEHFSVIRFGVQYDKNRNIGPKVVGLKDKQKHILNWIDYMNGSWQVYENWLIHEGAPDPSIDAWGAIGCIEITGNGEWDRFNDVIKALSNENDLNKISKAKTLISLYEEVSNRPPLKEKI